MLSSDNSGLNGVPIFLNARLWESIENKKDLMEPYYKFYDWDNSECGEYTYPEKLYFIAKAPKLSFDFYQYRSGMIVSSEFLELISEYTSDFSFVPLETYSNNMKNITIKKYYFLKVNSYLTEGFDFEKSIYDINIADNGEVMMFDSHPWVTDIQKIVLKESIVRDKDIFCIHGGYFFNRPFISEELLQKCLEKKLYGIKYVEVNKTVDFFKNDDYLKKTPAVIE